MTKPNDKSGYAAWLTSAGYDPGTVTAQIYRVDRVEEFYGDISQAVEQRTLHFIVAELTYSAEDERRGRPNPSRIPFQGPPRTNLASYRTSVEWYRRYCDGKELPKSRGPANGQGGGHNSSQEPSNAVTFSDFNFHGTAVLRKIIEASRYKSLAQAVASLAVFSHPDTVLQAKCRAIFATVRDPNARGVFGEVDGQSVMFDDNKSATDAYFWSNGLGARTADCQINHVYNLSRDVNAYTNLANLCMTPAFLAKLTDSNEEVRNVLRYRVFDLYGWTPDSHKPPAKPEEYASLDWAPTLPAIPDLRAAIEARMHSKPKDRTVVSARKIGWLFGKGQDS